MRGHADIALVQIELPTLDSAEPMETDGDEDAEVDDDVTARLDFTGLSRAHRATKAEKVSILDVLHLRYISRAITFGENKFVPDMPSDCANLWVRGCG